MDDVVTALRIVRVAMGGCVITLAVAYALRRRVEWWQVIWLLIYTSHYLVFTTYILIAGWMNVINTPFARTWSLLLDIHGSLAVLMYLIVVSRGANGHRIFWRDLFRHVRRVRGGDVRKPDHTVYSMAAQWEALDKELERDRSNHRRMARPR